MQAELIPLWDLLEHYFSEARKLVEGLSTEQLNWKPLAGDSSGEATNSLYGLALHIAFVSMQILAKAIGQAPLDYPEMHHGNNGQSSHGSSPDRAIELLNEAQTYVQHALETLAPEQLEELRERRVGNWVGESKSVRWMILHILEHAALHIGHMEITHQLLLQA